MIPLELALIDDDAYNKLTFQEQAEYRKRAAQFGEEGVRSAYALLQYGHDGLRVVVDSDWELAITCDSCGLWGQISQKVRHDRRSAASVGGSIFEVVSCDQAERHRRFGSYSGEDAWAGYTAWNADQPLISHREGEFFYPEGDKKRRVGGKSGWMKRHDAMKKIEGVKDEATTKK